LVIGSLSYDTQRIHQETSQTMLWIVRLPVSTRKIVVMLKHFDFRFEIAE
jgi:hypothetical protein